MTFDNGWPLIDFDSRPDSMGSGQVYDPVTDKDVVVWMKTESGTVSLLELPSGDKVTPYGYISDVYQTSEFDEDIFVSYIVPTVEGKVFCIDGGECRGFDEHKPGMLEELNNADVLSLIADLDMIR